MLGNIASHVGRAVVLAATLAAAPAAPAAPGFDLQGHRGARGLAPENTLAGFRRALEVGVHTLELDTGVTRDGVVVVVHDRRLNPAIVRGPDGRWLTAPTPAIVELRFDELRRYDVGRLRPGTGYARAHPDQQAVDGERIPSLDEVFEWARPKRVRFNIETKLSPLEPALSVDPQTFVRRLLEAIERHGMAGRVSLQSFDWRTLSAARRLAPAIPRVALTDAEKVGDPRWTDGLRLDAHGSVPKLVKASGATAWSPRFDTLTRETLAEAHGLGLAVVVWTVNERADIERLLDWGVDGIISDRPDRVRAAMAARGMPLPSP